MTVKIFLGDCREVLATLEPETVQMVLTSPPYWGLRDYLLPPTIWGGDPNCSHDWGEPVVKKRTAGGEREYGSSDGKVGRGPPPVRPTSQFCTRCGCWRGSLGAEPTIELYVANLVEAFRAVRRVLRGDGTVWLNLGDVYAGSTPGTNKMEPVAWTGADGKVKKAGMTRAGPVPGLKPKDLCMIPARVALALQADGWWVRSQIIWKKPSCMPESCQDRPTLDYEMVYLLSKNKKYFYDYVAIMEPVTGNAHARGDGVNPKARDGDRQQSRQNESFSASVAGLVSKRNRRSVWEIPPKGFKGLHFATFPPALAEIPIRAGTSQRGACGACGAGWARVVEKTGHKNKREPAHVPGNTATKTDSTGWSPTTVGTNKWRPTCTCPDSAPVPCSVLDPFGGAGTTGLVADRLGRDAILIELNPEYATMAAERIRADGGMFSDIQVITPVTEVREND